MLCEQTGAVLKVVPIDRRGVVDHDAYLAMLGPRTRLAAFAHVSNALGTVLPVREMVAAARERGIVTLIDGAQAVPHQAVDVRARLRLLRVLRPQAVRADRHRRALRPRGAAGGHAALAGRRRHDPDRVLLGHDLQRAALPVRGRHAGHRRRHRPRRRDRLRRLARHGPHRRLGAQLLDYATARLAAMPGLEIVGTAPQKASLVSFTIEGVHPHDLGTILDAEGIAIRTGHHCAMPVMDFFDVPATARASFAFYNTREEIDVLAAALGRAREMLG
jgi:cysteine desulfurase / selenocysteine lyase